MVTLWTVPWITMRCWCETLFGLHLKFCFCSVSKPSLNKVSDLVCPQSDLDVFCVYFHSTTNLGLQHLGVPREMEPMWYVETQREAFVLRDWLTPYGG